jgi:hypothetical protein
MIEIDAVRRFLRERGCPDDVVAGGLEGLIEEWERAVRDVERGYPLGLDDYLNDLDGRQLLEEALPLAAVPDREAARARIRAADERMKRCVRSTDECLWGDRVAEAEGWTPIENWWYFRVPRSPGPLLREDLEHD